MNIPKVILAKQSYPDMPEVADPRKEAEEKLNSFGLKERVSPGMKIAITAGSRGVHGMIDVIAQTVRSVRECGGEPFVFPAMGSHGGATAEGQLEMLRGLGYTADVLGCPIYSSMETECIGQTGLGTPVYVDKNALAADGVIVVNRIKKHTEHNNRTESGLLKMMTVGMGKRDMAAYVHSNGVWGLSNIIPENGKFVCRSPEVNVICGIALIENQDDRLGYLEVVNGYDIPDREPELFKLANKLYPQFPFSTCDLLVVCRGGKNISGTGMDTNMIGRYGVWGLNEPEKYYSSGIVDFNQPEGAPLIEKIALLDLTEESHGNAMGVGQADIITKRYFDKIDMKTTYMNGVTSTFLDKIKIPYVAENDKTAIQVGLDCLNGLMGIEGKKTEDTVSLCIIDSTLHRGRYYVSKGLYDKLKSRGDITFSGGFTDLRFDDEGTLLSNPLLNVC